MFGLNSNMLRLDRLDLQPALAVSRGASGRALAEARRAYGDIRSADILVPLTAAAAIAAYGFYLRLW